MKSLGKIKGGVDLTHPKLDPYYFAALILVLILVYAAIECAKYGFGVIKEKTAGTRGQVEEAVATVM